MWLQGEEEEADLAEREQAIRISRAGFGDGQTELDNRSKGKLQGSAGQAWSQQFQGTMNYRKCDRDKKADQKDSSHGT